MRLAVQKGKGKVLGTSVRYVLRRLVSWTICVLLVASCSGAQQCLPPVLSRSHALNLFNEQQEYDLGEIFAQRIAFSQHIIEDETVAGRLQSIGGRLIAQMPPTKLHFRFFLVDSPTANAFAIPGGRVYVTRKLVTTVRSEDELAGVMGHEIGHQLAHHGALDWSRIFHDGLGVTELGDRADIEDKYNQVLDTYRTKGTLSTRNNEEHEQTGADQVAVYAVARAGYSPQAVIDFWDRFTETGGKKGNWLSDFFGTPRPESKRLREFVNDLRSLPAGCIQSSGSNSSPSDFAAWQTTVANYRGFGKKESLHHVLLKRSLDPALRADINNLRFSPDGKYILAQDNAGIFVLNRDPLTNLFHIDAPDALAGRFSPDSRYVVVFSEGLRVEQWNIAEERKEDVREPYIFGGCVQAALSPDGDYLACIRPDRDKVFPLVFTLYDVITSAPILTKKDFIGTNSSGWATYFNYLSLMSRRSGIAAMSFSPDGRYFILGRYDAHLMVDLKSKSEVKVPDGLRKLTTHSFAFLGSDRVIGAESPDLKEATIVKIPSGETVTEHIPIGGRTLYPVTRGPYALVRPMLKAPLGIIDVDARKIFRASRTDATDIFDDVIVSERLNGEIALYHLHDEKPFATVNLPRAPLGHLSAVGMAPQASAIAISQMTRGAVWNLQTGEQLATVRGFRGAYFDRDALYLDFAPSDLFGELPREGETLKDVRLRDSAKPGDSLARVDLTTRSIDPVSAMQKRTSVRQSGSVVLTWTAADDDQPGRDITLEARDARTGKVMWSRFYAKGFPWINTNTGIETAVFSWYLGTKGAKEELKDDPETRRLVDNLKETDGGYLVEVVDLRSGLTLGKFPIETGLASFTARIFMAAGGTLAMIDSNDRVSLYSYKGERKGRLFGGDGALSPDGKRLCVEREPGRAVLYDVERARELDEMTFASRVAYTAFTADSRQLVILTSDQTAFVFAVQPAPAN